MGLFKPILGSFAIVSSVQGSQTVSSWLQIRFHYSPAQSSPVTSHHTQVSIPPPQPYLLFVDHSTLVPTQGHFTFRSLLSAMILSKIFTKLSSALFLQICSKVLFSKRLFPSTVSEIVSYFLAFFLLLYCTFHEVTTWLSYWFYFPLQNCELDKGKSFVCVDYSHIPTAVNSFWHQVGTR